MKTPALHEIHRKQEHAQSPNLICLVMDRL